MTLPIQKAGAIIIRKQEEKEIEVLLFYHHRQKDWTFPKGHQESGESLEECMHREVREETGLQIRILKELPPLTYTDANEHAVFVQMSLVTPLEKGASLHLEHDGDRLEWVPLSETVERLSYQNLKEYFKHVQRDVEGVLERDIN